MENEIRYLIQSIKEKVKELEEKLDELSFKSNLNEFRSVGNIDFSNVTNKPVILGSCSIDCRFIC